MQRISMRETNATIKWKRHAPFQSERTVMAFSLFEQMEPKLLANSELPKTSVSKRS